MPKVVRCTALVSAGVAMLALLLTAISATYADAAKERGRYIVVLRDSVEHPAAVAERHTVNRDADVGHIYRYAIKGYSAELAKNALEAVLHDPAVAYVEPDLRGGIAAQETPTGVDRIFASSNKALDIDEKDDSRVNADVAVFDTGVAEHSDLEVVSRVNCNGSETCVEGGTDGNGHGTHVAGTIAAIDNGFGVVGVAPGARIWSVKVLDDFGFGELSEFIAGIDWVTARAKQIEVANASLRYWGVTSSKAFSEALDASIGAGIVHVAAAGNESETVQYVPGVDPDEITVSALEDFDGSPSEGNDQLASFSNFGTVVDAAAPGVGIFSTVPGGYGYSSGTSMASPHIAGAAAILAGRDKPESKEDVKAIRDTIVEEGNFSWKDTSGDGIKEPLLDVGNEAVFNLSEPPAPAWKILSTPNPEGASDSNLYDVSCEPSTNVCTSVGKSTSSGVDSPVAQRWNGTSWSSQSPAKKSGTLPTRLFGVDCPSETRCIAVGSYQPSEGGPATVAEIWNENKWSVQSTPVPSGATSSELVAVGCSSTASCVGVGSAVIGGVKTAIAERWASPTWSLESIPIPAGATSSQLDGVDCIWSNFCVAVGRYTTSGGSVKSLVLFWNGSWSLQTPTDPGGAVQSTLLDVSCTQSPSRCMAVGGWKNSATEQFTLAYRFNGSSTWTLQSTPNPSGSIASVFQDVSCATETSCTAAGSWVGGGFSNRTLAENWNGTTWSIQGTPNPSGATFSAFFGVSCRSTTCMGVGWSTDGSGVDTTLAETSDLGQPPTVEAKSASDLAPTKATLNGTVDPNGSETTYQFEYGTTTSYGSKAPASPKSIGSGTSPVEVSEKIEGLAPETTYHFRLVATNAKGTTKGSDQTFTTPSWAIVSTPNPSGASDSNLYDVSCEPSTSVCTSVGKSTVSGADIPVAQRWNGTTWSEQSPDKKSGTLPTRLFGVDCPSETRCLAVGNYQPSEGGPTLVAEIWNEGNWNVQTTPVPSGATSSELVAIGCNSTAQCRAAGSAVIGGVKTAIIEAWTSPNWTLMTVPIPEGASSSQLDGIDCIWSNVCVAVGRYTASGSTKSLAMLWNGTSWSLQTLTAPEGAVQTTLLDVACTPSPTRCTAVGGWKNSAGEQFTLVYRFNGSTWTLQSTPNPSGATESVLHGVSCATETSCAAVGSSVSGGSTKTLAENWNGTTWSIQGTSNPSGATFSSLFGVSCRSTTCMGVGWSTDGSGIDTTLVEIRE